MAKPPTIVSVPGPRSGDHHIFQWLLGSFLRISSFITWSLYEMFHNSFCSISSQRPAFFSLTLLSRFMVHRHIEIWNMEMTRDHISFTFDPRNMLLSFQFGFNFVRATVACSVIERSSGFEPSSKTTAPRYLKLVMVPSFFALLP